MAYLGVFDQNRDLIKLSAAPRELEPSTRASLANCCWKGFAAYGGWLMLCAARIVDLQARNASAVARSGDRGFERPESYGT